MPLAWGCSFSRNKSLPLGFLHSQFEVLGSGKCDGPHGISSLHLSVGIGEMRWVPWDFSAAPSERIPFRYLVPGTWANRDGGDGGAGAEGGGVGEGLYQD